MSSVRRNDLFDLWKKKHLREKSLSEICFSTIDQRLCCWWLLWQDRLALWPCLRDWDESLPSRTNRKFPKLSVLGNRFVEWRNKATHRSKLSKVDRKTSAVLLDIHASDRCLAEISMNPCATHPMNRHNKHFLDNDSKDEYQLTLCNWYFLHSTSNHETPILGRSSRSATNWTNYWLAESKAEVAGSLIFPVQST